MHKMSLAAAALLVASQIGSVGAQAQDLTVRPIVRPPSLIQNLGVPTIDGIDTGISGENGGDNRDSLPLY